MNIKEYMYKLLSDLDQQGYILRYYEEYSTSHCCIEIDHGVNGFIRISNHKGKDNYPYKFNLILDLKESYKQNANFYYSLKDYKKLLLDINKFRDEQLNRLGFSYYENMLENKKNNKNKKGFLSKFRNYNDKF